MSSYADIVDLNKYGLPTAALSPFSDQEKQDALNGASAIADSYLQQRFDLPLTQWGQDLRMHVVKIACFFMMSRRGFNPQARANAEDIRQAYNDAISWLKDVAKGVALPVDVVDASTDAAGDNNTGVPFDPTFTLQAHGAQDDCDGFWGDTSSCSSTVRTPKLRGW